MEIYIMETIKKDLKMVRVAIHMIMEITMMDNGNKG